MYVPLQIGIAPRRARVLRALATARQRAAAAPPSTHPAVLIVRLRRLACSELPKRISLASRRKAQRSVGFLQTPGLRYRARPAGSIALGFRGSCGEAAHAARSMTRRSRSARRRFADYVPPRCCSPLALRACSPPVRRRASGSAAARQPGGSFDFEGWDQYLGGADSSQYSSLEADRQEQRRPASKSLGRIATDENYLVQPARSSAARCTCSRRGARSSRSTRRPAASSGRTPTKARSRHARHELLAQPRRQRRSACCT